MQEVDKKKDRKYFISHLREAFLWSKTRAAAQAQARVARGKYKCAKCNLIYKRQSIQVDHIKELIQAKEKFLSLASELACITSRAYSPKNLQVLCKSCHAKKGWEQTQK